MLPGLLPLVKQYTRMRLSLLFISYNKIAQPCQHGKMDTRPIGRVSVPQNDSGTKPARKTEFGLHIWPTTLVEHFL